MRANRMIRFMITEEQFQRIKNKATSKGFVTISEYLRHVALALDLSIEEKIEKLWEERLAQMMLNLKTK